MMSVAVVCAKVGMLCNAFNDCAKNTFHCAVVSLLLAAVVPHQVMFTLPASPAVIHGPIALFVPDPLLTRTGTDHVAAWSRDVVRKTLWLSEKTIYRLPALSIASDGKTFTNDPEGTV